jgi:hypothetical protein
MTKNKPQVKIVDLETGEEIVRDATAEEIAQIEKDAVDYEIYKAALAEKETSKQAILDRIGLTSDELKTILG